MERFQDDDKIKLIAVVFRKSPMEISQERYDVLVDSKEIFDDTKYGKIVDLHKALGEFKSGAMLKRLFSEAYSNHCIPEKAVVHKTLGVEGTYIIGKLIGNRKIEATLFEVSADPHLFQGGYHLLGIGFNFDGNDVSFAPLNTMEKAPDISKRFKNAASKMGEVELSIQRKFPLFNRSYGATISFNNEDGEPKIDHVVKNKELNDIVDKIYIEMERDLERSIDADASRSIREFHELCTTIDARIAKGLYESAEGAQAAISLYMDATKGFIHLLAKASRLQYVEENTDQRYIMKNAQTFPNLTKDEKDLVELHARTLYMMSDRVQRQ